MATFTDPPPRKDASSIQVLRWLQRIDPGGRRRAKGFRLVAAYGLASMAGTLACSVQHQAVLSSLAGGFALWASVSEASSTRAQSCRDLLLLTAAAALGAASFILLAHPLHGSGRPAPELILVSGAFLVGYLRRFGLIGAGIGSQIFIGQLLAYGAQLGVADVSVLVWGWLISAFSAVIPRMVSDMGEPSQPAQLAPVSSSRRLRPETVMGLQGSVAALAIVAVNAVVTLTESAWAITACTYVIVGSATGTYQRVRQRIIGTAIGVPLGLACLPLATVTPIALWAAAALAMVIYAMALPKRYDIACGAFAYTLIVTLAVSGEHSIALLASRIWETFFGAAVGLVAATLILPLGSERESASVTNKGPSI
jgi:hypothetical protein